ncbi:MAG: efflux RND transporter permease subunit [Planctomycetes bacterium]|nr:efflux RND transporter permease subunit [Planctomycetota bacterium]
MLNALVSASMRLRVAVLAVALALVVFGFQRAGQTPLDVFPEFAPPLIELQTEAPGLTSAEVESLVTLPLESALNGLPWVRTVRSKSVLGLSSVVLILERGADLLRARQLVQERVAIAASRLPGVALAPVILSPLSSTSRVMKIGLTSSSLTQIELTTLARWTIRPKLMSVAGVANVAIWGQRDRQLQVLVDPERLNALGLTLNDIQRAAGDAASIVTGGFVDTPNQRLAIRHVAQAATVEDLARSVVTVRNGVALRLGEVADVVEGFPPPIGDAVINDDLGLMLIVEKQPWGNTLDVTYGVEAALDALAPGLADVTIDRNIFRPATFIETALANLTHALWIGCALVVLVLALFLFEWRTALISVTAIPLSLIAAALVLGWFGETLNTMVLSGLVIALGEVVDDAIIDVENIVRRLRLNHAAGSPRSAFATVLDASLEVRSAVVFGSFVVAAVLLPVFSLGGLAGAFFQPLALAYITAILASLAVALTLTPAMCLILLPGAAARSHDPWLTRALRGVYGRMLPALATRPVAVSLVMVLALLGGGALYSRLGEEFLPRFKERDFLMHWVEKPGTSLEAMQRITIRVSKELRSIPGVNSFGAHIGRAEVADEVVGPNFTELWISFDPAVDYDATVASVQEVVDGYPGLYRDLLTYLKERIKEVLTGASASVVVRIFGPDLDTLRDKAREVAAAIGDIEGVADLKVEPQVLVPQIEIRMDPEAAARFGLRAADVRSAVTTLVSGTRVGQVFDSAAIYDVAVWGAPHLRDDPSSLRELRIDTPSGAQVKLSDVCAVTIAPTPNEIKRENASRRLDVTCNVVGRDLGGVARDIEQRLKSVEFERGYHPELLGEYAEREASQRRLLSTSLVSMIAILLLMQIDFASWRLAFLVVLTLPVALVGGLVGAHLGGGVLSLGSMIGFVTVLGIAARNSIMLVSHYRHLELVENQPFGLDLVVRGAVERVVPILMTVLCAGLALLPMVVGGDKPGQEIEHPLAIVIVGGLVTSTALCLFALPALYLRFARPRA